MRLSKWRIAYWILCFALIGWVLLPKPDPDRPSFHMWPWGDQLAGAGFLLLYFAGLYRGWTAASRGERTSVSLVISCAFVAIGIWLTLATYKGHVDEAALRARQIQITGTVSGFQESPDGNPHFEDGGVRIYNIVVHFIVNGAKKEESYWVGERIGRTHPKGSPLEILYDPLSESAVLGGDLYEDNVSIAWSWIASGAFLLPGIGMALLILTKGKRNIIRTLPVPPG